MVNSLVQVIELPHGQVSKTDCHGITSRQDG